MRWFIGLLMGVLLGGAGGIYAAHTPPTSTMIDTVFASGPPVSLLPGAARLSAQQLASVGLQSCFDGAYVAQTLETRPWLQRDIASAATSNPTDMWAYPDLAEYPGLVKLEHVKSVGGSEREHCGAARIAEHWFLTASHCVMGRGTDLDVAPVDLVLVTPAIDVRSEGTQVAPVRGALCHASYRMNLLQWPNDVALLYVEDVSAFTGIPLATLEGQAPQWARDDITNAHISAWGSNGRNRFLQGGAVEITELGEAIVLTDPLDGRGPNVGDSGSPLYATIHGEPLVVGVLSQVTQGEASGLRRGVFVRVKSVADWIATAQQVCMHGDAYIC